MSRKRFLRHTRVRTLYPLRDPARRDASSPSTLYARARRTDRKRAPWTFPRYLLSGFIFLAEGGIVFSSVCRVPTNAYYSSFTSRNRVRLENVRPGYPDGVRLDEYKYWRVYASAVSPGQVVFATAFAYFRANRRSLLYPVSGVSLDETCSFFAYTHVHYVHARAESS